MAIRSIILVHESANDPEHFQVCLNNSYEQVNPAFIQLRYVHRAFENNQLLEVSQRQTYH